MPSLKNPKHERYARLLAQGLTQVEAFSKIYPDQKKESVNTNACKLANQFDVKARYAEIKDLIDSQFAMSVGEKRDQLRRMIAGEIPTKVTRRANGQVEATYDRLAALQADAKLGGEYAPEQHIHTTGPTLKLDFRMVGRNTMTPDLAEEWRRLTAPEVKNITPPETIEAQVERYELMEISKQTPSLKSIEGIIDEESSD